MKKKNGMFFVLGLGVLPTLLTSCSNPYTLVKEGKFEIGYCEKKNNAFIGTVQLSENESMKTTIPNEYNGMPVTDLGGVIGKDTDTPFSVLISPSTTANYTNIFTAGWEFLTDGSMDKYKSRMTCTYYPEITLPANLKSITNIKNLVLVCEDTNANPSPAVDVFKAECVFTVDAANETFYANEGKVYYKANNQLVEGLPYGSPKKW